MLSIVHDCKNLWLHKLNTSPLCIGVRVWCFPGGGGSWKFARNEIVMLMKFNILSDKSSRIFFFFLSIYPNIHGFPKVFFSASYAYAIVLLMLSGRNERMCMVLTWENMQTYLPSHMLYIAHFHPCNQQHKQILQRK
jgi:hypothetical protein